MQSREAFEKDIYEGAKELKDSFAELVAQAEQYAGDTQSLVWHTYTRNRDLQKRFIEEIEHAVSMPKLAPEVIGMRYRLWEEFASSVEALGGQSVPEKKEELTPAPEQDLTVYKETHPAPPREDEITVRKEVPKPMLRVKPKPAFTAAPPKKMDAMPTKEVPKKQEQVEEKKSEVRPSKKETPLPEDAVQKVRQSIIDRVGKKAQGFLDGIFGSLGNDDVGLSKIGGLSLSNIIEIEKLSPDAHTAKLDDLGVSQKEWESWIDWVNESNRIVSATVSATLEEYVNQVAKFIARTK